MKTGEYQYDRIFDYLDNASLTTWLLNVYTDEYVEELFSNPELKASELKPLLYLAWLYANGLIYEPFEVDDAYEIDYNAYDQPDGGYNLDSTYNKYCLDELEVLLKGLFRG